MRESRCCPPTLRARFMRKLGACARCMRTSALTGVAATSGALVLWVVSAPAVAVALATAVAVAATALWITHCAAFVVKAARARAALPDIVTVVLPSGRVEERRLDRQTLVRTLGAAAGVAVAGSLIAPGLFRSGVALAQDAAGQLESGNCATLRAGSREHRDSEQNVNCETGTVCANDRRECDVPERGPVNEQCFTYRRTTLQIEDGERAGGKHCWCACEMLVQLTGGAVGLRPCFGTQRHAWVRNDIGANSADAVACVRGLPAR